MEEPNGRPKQIKSIPPSIFEGLTTAAAIADLHVRQGQPWNDQEHGELLMELSRRGRISGNALAILGMKLAIEWVARESGAHEEQRR